MASAGGEARGASKIIAWSLLLLPAWGCVTFFRVYMTCR